MLPSLVQVSKSNILYSWVDSADWVEGIEYRLCMTPPRQPLQRYASRADLHVSLPPLHAHTYQISPQLSHLWRKLGGCQ